MSFEEQSENEGQGADMWLCYPPLAGKVLRLIDLEGRGEPTLIQVILRLRIVV